MHPAIAIDGPAASGKSTVAKLIADRLGYTFINTGAMYRAVTWYMLEQGINPADTAAVLESLPSVPLSFGKDGERTILSGIAKYYKPEDLVGTSVCFIANFPPRKLRGIVSEGMILSVENSDGSLRVVHPDSDCRPGTTVG